jgi:hypothetical protein
VVVTSGLDEVVVVAELVVVVVVVGLVVVVVVGVPDKLGASDGVTGAVTGIWLPGGCPVWGGNADIATQVSQSTAQSQMSPSE